MSINGLNACVGGCATDLICATSRSLSSHLHRTLHAYHLMLQQSQMTFLVEHEQSDVSRERRWTPKPSMTQYVCFVLALTRSGQTVVKYNHYTQQESNLVVFLCYSYHTTGSVQFKVRENGRRSCKQSAFLVEICRICEHTAFWTLTLLRKYWIEMILFNADAIFASKISESEKPRPFIDCDVKRSSTDLAISTTLIHTNAIVGHPEFQHTSFLKLTFQH